LRRSTPSRNSSRRSLMSSSATSLIDTAPMEVQAAGGADQADDIDQDNWAIRNHKTRTSSSNAESALEAHNRRWSMMSFEQQQQSVSPPMAQYQNVFADYSTQVQQHGRPPQSQILIRCLCGIQNDRGFPLIQCHSCTQWLHRPCVGLDAQVQPPRFTCFLCTRPPSNMPPTSIR
jgi:hypothetical protein